MQNFQEVTERAKRQPETAQHVPEIVTTATERWQYMTSWLVETSDEVNALQRSILHGLETGALVPEQPADRRPRIVLAPRPVPVRAFLRLRQPAPPRFVSLLLLRAADTPPGRPESPPAQCPGACSSSRFRLPALTHPQNETVVSTESTNPHVEAAQARLQELRLMRDQIPRFLIPESTKEVGRLNSAASVPPEFVELTAVAVANQKALERVESATPAEIRDLLR